ncbi:2-oxoacid:ferredoxin oxidoreductase subunit beta [Thermoanaerobacterium thermosaccharolyticum]|uniref:2-oxoacid:ferredoxin oxidoreductase subunit beta n=1 Tax=Thermoanaerobacterium thermosaccharolyticum TaxID=1517 RepID=UPI00123A60C2|nr:2-oxoacid:ferredoxin oxidoreductase subunit beta [Thermoanaerobacterium thermosaccharolyticum]KAA5805780.1 2-oxoacid:ferredoxin oxidoreductase subunit beta [Thermoanaerobacterium thermosaccharolyticum]
MNTAFETYETAWCPGCGNFGILNALKDALTELGLKPHQVVIASGIGQAAKMPHYINVNGFNGLHGRALPPATAINIVNKDLKVIINSGDGDTYGEGGNHFIHAIRRNANIAHFVHDNQIYGLTKGQASPTTAKGQKTSLQFDGVILDPVKPIKLALTMGAGFVARSFSGNYEHLKKMMKEAIMYDGYALLDIFQPCVTFNRVNTFKWYNDRVYELPDDYDYTDLDNAFKVADEWGDRIPIGIIYKVEKPTYIDNIKFLKDGPPLIDVPLDPLKAEKYMEDFK